MNCPKCGNKFRVMNTASTDDSPRMHLRSLCNDLVQWYSSDYVVRQRSCTVCMYVTITVEIERDDLIEMLRIVSHEEVPEQLEKYIGKKSDNPDKSD